MVDRFLNEIRRRWASGGLNDEGEFRHLMLCILGEAQALADLNDWEAVRNLRTFYRSVRNQCRTKPLYTAYTHGELLFGCLYTEHAVLKHEWDFAFRCADKTLNCLQQLNKRRAEEDCPPKKHNEVRWVILRSLALAKAIGPQALKDRLFTPGQIARQYQVINQDARTRLLNDYDENPEKRDRGLESLSWCGLAICKMIVRHLSRHKLIEAVMDFNWSIGVPTIYIEEGKWQKALDEQVDCLGPTYLLPGRAVWFWDFEIFKSWNAGKLKYSELNTLHEHRIQARKAEATAPVQSYMSYLEQEHALMAASIRHNWEVLGSG